MTVSTVLNEPLRTRQGKKNGLTVKDFLNYHSDKLSLSSSIEKLNKLLVHEGFAPIYKQYKPWVMILYMVVLVALIVLCELLSYHGYQIAGKTCFISAILWLLIPIFVKYKKAPC